MMMRKTSLILLGAAAGIAVTLIATSPRIVLDGARAQAAAADTYRQLSLFGDVFERVRLKEVLTYTSADNYRSQAVMTRLNLQREPSLDYAEPQGAGMWHGMVWVARSEHPR